MSQAEAEVLFMADFRISPALSAEEVLAFVLSPVRAVGDFRGENTEADTSYARTLRPLQHEAARRWFEQRGPR